jgi:hypothetical protein
MPLSLFDRFVRPFRPAGYRCLQQGAADRLGFGEVLWAYPEQLGLTLLSEAQRQPLDRPLPPHMRRLLRMYARFFSKRPQLAQKLGIPEDLLPAMVRCEVNVSRATQLSANLRTAAADSGLVLAGGMRTVNGEIEAAAQKAALAAATDPADARIQGKFADADRRKDLAAARKDSRSRRLRGQKQALTDKEAAARARIDRDELARHLQARTRTRRRIARTEP